MVHTESQVNLDARRYLLASLSVHWRFRHLAPPSGLLSSRPVIAQKDSKAAAGSLQEQQLIRSHRMQR
jgi:hypothetical protein